MASTPTITATTSTIATSSNGSGNGGGGLAYPSADPNRNPNPDPFAAGPSVYLYGFLATLILIFLVSVGVAYRGYHTRRILRARIDAAIARGAYIPNYDPARASDIPLFPASADPDEYFAAMRVAGRRPGRGGYGGGVLPPRPVLWDEWVDLEKEEKSSDILDVKPAAVTTLRTIPPAPEQQAQASNPSSLLRQLVDPFRQYFFVTPPEGSHPNHLRGRPASPYPQSNTTTAPSSKAKEPEAKQKDELEDVEDVVVSFFISMPDPSRPRPCTHDRCHHFHLEGIHEREEGQPVASGSRPTSHASYIHSMAVSASARPPSVTKEEELPELVLGIVLWSLKPPVKEEKEEEEPPRPEGEGPDREGQKET